MSVKNFTQNTYQAFMALPGWAKGVIGVGVGVGVFFVGKKLYNFAFPSPEDKANRALANAIDAEINAQKKAGMVTSFPESSFATFANTIYEGMRYCVGDNYGSVETTLKQMKNDLDVATLIKAFGIRQNYCFGVNVGSPMDLMTFVRKELGNDFGGLTDYRVQAINNDWAKKGIKYKI